MQKTLPIHFAPLQGYTDVFYRNAHAACFGGIDTYYTPFVRLEKGGFRHRDVRGIEPGNNQVPHLIPQHELLLFREPVVKLCFRYS